MDNDPQYKTPDGSALRIWKDSAKNNFRSEQEGRPVFDEVTYVEVISPGSQGSAPVFELRRMFAEEFGMEPLYGMQWGVYKQYVEAFDKDELTDASLVGTPLKEWPEISRTFAASLRASGIFSVDALAAVSDEKLSVIGPDGRTWRTKAQAYLEAAKSGAYATQIAAELETLRNDLGEKDKLIAELSAKLDAQAAQLAASTPAPAPAPAPTGKAGKNPADVI